MKVINPEFSKCKRIKKLIEIASGFDDIGIRSRKRPIPELKKTYCKLCKIFTSASLQSIGEVLGNYNHATTLHAINTFDNLLETKGLDFLDIYKELFDKLNKEKSLLIKAEDKGEIPLTITELHQKFRISLIRIIKKGHSIINRKQERIQQLESLLEETSDLIEPAKEASLEDIYVLRTKIKLSLLKK